MIQKKLEIEKDVLFEMYIHANLKAADIRRLTGVPEFRIRELLKRYGIRKKDYIGNDAYRSKT